MVSKLLIQDKFYQFDNANLSYQSEQKKNIKNEENKIIENNNLNKIKKTKSSESFISDESSIIELVDDKKNYTVYENEVKYKIFEDISSISKGVCGDLELILDIPYEHNVVSINKIKISNGLSKYIKNVYMMLGEKIIMTKEELINTNNKIKIMRDNKNTNDYHNINLSIILDKDSLNHIVNKNIFVNYSYTILKNKLKFI